MTCLIGQREIQRECSIVRLSPDLSESRGLIEQAWELLALPVWPKDEIRSLHEALDRFFHPESYGCTEIVHVAVTQGSVVGMVVAHFLPQTRSCFGEYLATSNRAEVGMGKKLYYLNRDWMAHLGAEKLLLEYDDPIDLSREGLARWRWYQRLGVYRLIWPYWQPPYRNGDMNKPMALAYDTRVGAQRSSPHEIALGIGEIYEKIYRVNPQIVPYRDVIEQIHSDSHDWLVDISGRPVVLIDLTSRRSSKT